MRQVFLSTPWIHHEEPEKLRQIYYQYGQHRKIKKDAFLPNGGENAQISLLLNGLGTFSFQGLNEKPIIFSLIIPNRVLGDMDGVSGQLVNVNVRLIRDSEILSVERKKFLQAIEKDPSLHRALTQSLIAKQESNLEAMIACHTLDVEARLKVFLKCLLTSTQNIITAGWQPVRLYLSHEEYASIINASRVTISKLFSAWENKNLLIKKGRTISVHTDLFNDVYDWLESKR